MSHEDELKQAIALIKSGDKAGGAKILKTILKANRDNERAWMWMSACVETDDDRIYCLQEVLRINPQNENARKALEKLQPGGVDLPARTPAHSPIASQPIAQRAASQPVASRPAPVAPATTTDASSTLPVSPPQHFPPSGGMGKNAKIILMVLGILVGLCLICGGIGWYVYDQGVKQVTEAIGDMEEVSGKDFAVEYVVSGQARNLRVSYTKPNMEEEAITVKTLPWSKKYTLPGASLAGVTATNTAAGGTLTCEIKVNGKVVSTESTTVANQKIECATMVGVMFP